MRKALGFLLIPAAFAVVAGVGLATTPAKADVRLNLNVPFFYSTPYYYSPYYYAPPSNYYAPRCYWDAYYGRVCY